ncbi:hypothetical protein D8Y22_02505 [Salinadaptatus halalkaliphilus]|uniref:DUF7312 domain-containing protein n=1 Tax=Salinadaptatus halalkaliphilus TaxID=2419781 RepID=A0A4S3TUU7_9EURY|nr:hypothetical protein [Salinadaptatus halalkaliphilus]THE66448.1 hypothetical protein D8Y22_02505 [Salinadaptatus halalkaliphilus]
MTDDSSAPDRGDDATPSTPDVPERDAGPETDWHPDTRPITAEEPADPESESMTDDGSDRITLDLRPEADDESDAAEDDPHAPEPSSTPIEAGNPDLEHVLFVVLGAIAMVLVLVQLVTIPL